MILILINSDSRVERKCFDVVGDICIIVKRLDSLFSKCFCKMKSRYSLLISTLCNTIMQVNDKYRVLRKIYNFSVFV